MPLCIELHVFIKQLTDFKLIYSFDNILRITKRCPNSVNTYEMIECQTGFAVKLCL